MHVPRTGRTVCGLCTLMLLAACGGGGGDSGELRSYDTSVRPVLTTDFYAQVGTAIPISPGAGTGAVVMAITPDDSTLFVTGVAGVFVQPVAAF